MGNLVGNLVGNSVGNIAGNLVGNSVGNLAGNLVGNLVGNAVGNLAGKYSFLKPILKRFSHMTYQIEAKNLLYKIKIFGKVLMLLRGLTMAKNPNIGNLACFLPFLSLFQPLKHCQTIFFL